jgi:hypothetical protein
MVWNRPFGPATANKVRSRETHHLWDPLPFQLLEGAGLLETHNLNTEGSAQVRPLGIDGYSISLLVQQLSGSLRIKTALRQPHNARC